MIDSEFEFEKKFTSFAVAVKIFVMKSIWAFITTATELATNCVVEIIRVPNVFIVKEGLILSLLNYWKYFRGLVSLSLGAN